jgi:signal transduction histidine kinase
LNQDLDTFAAIAAHDLRSPASTILGFAQLLSEEHTPAEEVAVRAIKTIQKTASRMLELIDQLLDYAKMGKEHLNRTPFSLKAAAHEAIDNLNAQIQESGAKVLIGNLPEYKGDQILFRQIFQNLISNSIKFRAKDRVCEVNISSLEEKNGWIRLTVKDNCGGFDPKLSEVIFQPFKRGTNLKDTHGSGLGLATVRKIVELHGGKISATAQLNLGAEFTIELP